MVRLEEHKLHNRDSYGGKFYPKKVIIPLRQQIGACPNVVVKKGDTVSVNYIGWTKEDGIFDSSILNWQSLGITPQTDFETTYDYRPLDFEAGTGQMISGFDSGVIGMNINSVKLIEIPPEEAYGINPNAHPLGNKTLFFKINVVDIS